mmetsp:Transcript_65438/g.210979  ORF Transcript_65438/g.210979 Transcript_65438/m.210979 type:complete len:226 (+) Transcript_65438:400-1077(+)
MEEGYLAVVNGVAKLLAVDEGPNGYGLAAGERHIVSHNLALGVLEQPKLHIQIVHPLGPLAPAIHLVFLHADVPWEVQLPVLAEVLIQGHIAEVPAGVVKLQAARKPGQLAAHEVPLAVFLCLHCNSAPTGQCHCLCAQLGGPIIGVVLPLHEPKLHLHVLHEERKSIFRLDVVPSHVELAPRNQLRISRLDEAVTLKFEVVHHCARVPFVLVNGEIIADAGGSR